MECKRISAFSAVPSEPRVFRGGVGASINLLLPKSSQSSYIVGIIWKLAEAKNRLSEVVNLALTEGPQTITRRGDELVLISKEEYLRCLGEGESFTEFLMSGPSLEGVDLQRSSDEMRSVSL